MRRLATRGATPSLTRTPSWGRRSLAAGSMLTAGWLRHERLGAVGVPNGDPPRFRRQPTTVGPGPDNNVPPIGAPPPTAPAAAPNIQSPSPQWQWR
jgi:hypothetical protein